MSRTILIYSTAYFPFVGGAEVAVKEITDRLPDFEFDLITARFKRSIPKRERIGRVNIYRIGIGWPWFDKLYLAFFGHRLGIKLNRARKYHVVWAIMASFGGFAAMRFKKETGIKFLLTLQEGDPFDYILRKIRLVKSRFRKIFTTADGLQAISSYLLQWGKDMGFSGKAAAVIPNGVDLEKFVLKSGTRDGYRQKIINKLNLPADVKLVITASRLVVKNGVGDLIKAIALLDKKVHLLIAGDGELKNKLNQLSVDLGINDRVHFLGAVGHGELPEYFWGSDVFCRPSLSEGLGNAFLEAMAAGLPVVATPVGGIPDFLRDGETGLFCQVKNLCDVAEKLKKIFLDDDLKDKLKTSGKKMIKDKYSWELIAVQMKNLLTL